MAIVTSILTAGANTHLTSSEEANGVYTDFVSNGVVGTISSTNGIAPTTGSFAVNAQASPNATVAVSSGVAYVTGTPTSQGSQTFRIKNSASSNVNISANSSGSTKYDWVYIKLDPTNLNTPNTAGDNVATLVTSRSSSASTDDGTPPTYGYNIAVVTVANGFSTITNGNIQDKRVRSGMTSSTTTAATTGWSDLGYTPSSVTALGNRSYAVLFSSTDLTGTVSAAQRLRTTRTVAAPTRCTSLNGTTQYYSKTSPAGMTFTDDFVVSAWVKLTSYQAANIASRFNGTSGWNFYIDASGRLTIQGLNGGVGNYRRIVSYQSIPLNKWVHVSAQLDMSTYTATPTTCYVMIDGVDVPGFLETAGTNPTALVQAGDLNIGAVNAGTFFPGKIAQVAIYNAKVTQATILASMHQGLAGTETSLISAYSFNNTINDLNTTNANNLTANGSAVATNADSPFGGQADGTISSTLDYAIIQKVTFSTNTTVVVQVPEGCTIPTSGGVSAVSYSTQKAPYGMPVQKGKWTLDCLILSTLSAPGGAASTVYNPGGINLNVQIGSWTVGGDLLYSANPAGATVSTNVGISSSASTFSDSDLGALEFQNGLTAGSLRVFPYRLKKDITLATATPYYALCLSGAALNAVQTIRGAVSATTPESSRIYAENAYL